MAAVNGQESGKLAGIEALRGVAAIVVVLYHAARHLKQALNVSAPAAATQFGHAGVDLFFVLSGFIILMVHRKDLGQPQRWPRFAVKRFRRVMPTYWVALAITVGLACAAGHGWPPAWRLLCSASLAPVRSPPLLSLAWTLQFEIMFYALFSVMILHRRAGLAVIGVWGAGILLQAAGVLPFGAALRGPVFDIFNTGFFLGLAAAALLWRGTVPAPRLVFAAGVALFATAALAEDAGVLQGYAPVARLAYGVPSALMVLGVVEQDRTGRVHVARWLRMLGEASYSIYLFQFIFIGLGWKIMVAAALPDRLPALVTYAVLVGAAVGGGILTSWWVEQPLRHVRWRRKDAAKTAAAT